MNKKRISSIIFTFNLILLLLISVNFDFNYGRTDKGNLIQDNLNTSKNIGKIYINGTSDWIDFRNAGNCTGSGTYSDPYVIEDLIIDGDGTGSCIWIENSNVFFRIENCTVFNSGNNFETVDAAVKLNNVSNASLKQNIITDNLFGIKLFGDNNSISQNSISRNLGGILPAGDRNFISQNSITNNLYGIFWATGCTILKNNLTHNGAGIFHGYNLNISLNKIGYNDMFGILMPFGVDNLISDNLINNNDGTGILIKNSVRNTIIKNEILNNENHGIHFSSRWWSYVNEVSDNIIINNSIGILLNYSDYTILKGNIIDKNRRCGIELNNSFYCDILDNQINENYYGIRLRYSDVNSIVHNIINHNRYGIYFISSCSNDIIENTLHYNRICFYETEDSLYNNYINNDCIELKDQGINWIVIITIIGGVAIVGIIILLLLKKRT